MNVSIALTAALYGATIVNHVEVNELIKDPATGKVTGVRVRDLLHQPRGGVLGRGEGAGQSEFVVKAKVCIEARPNRLQLGNLTALNFHRV